MIEESFLPNLCLWPPQSRHLGQRLFQRANPAAQSEIQSSTDEKMNMIGHDHVSPNGNIEVALGPLGKKNEGGMKLITRQACVPVVRTKSDEVKRSGFKNPIETERSAPKFLLHAENL